MTRHTLIVATLFSLCGCASFVANEIVGVPTNPVPIVEVPRNAGDQTPMDLLTASTGDATADDGARLHYSIIDPADRGFRSRWIPADETVETWKKKNVVRMRIEEWDALTDELIGTSLTEFLARPADGRSAPTGTAVLLHGFGMERWQMMTWAAALAQDGWRTVLVDLRGHGRSGGNHRTWGPQDGKDLATVADALESENLIAGPLVVLGTSYGGVAALHWAARDDRVTAIVTLGAFVDPAGTILAGAELFSWLGRAAPKWVVTRGITRASERIKHDLADGDAVLRTLAGIRAPILIVHGDSDELVPLKDAERLHEASADSQLWVVPDTGHVGVFVRHDLIGPVVRCWLERVRSGNLDDARHDLDCVPGDSDPVAVEGAP